jgi:glycosyltransferase involved in cell wall biosynthesis
MHSPPTFSVLVPTFNQAEYLVHALESLVSQTDTDWEAVVVNDGSTDSTAEVIAAFERRDRRIKGHYKDNGGTGSALNYGLKRAEGEWICWLSSDDLFGSRKLEIHRDWFSREPRAQFFHTHFHTIDAEGTVLQSPPLWRSIPPKEWQVLEMLKTTYIHGLSVCIRREVMLGVGGFDEKLRYGQDYDLWLRLLTQHAATFIPERTCVQRSHSGQTTNTFPEACFYDSARAAITLLNTHTFTRLVSGVDLSNRRKRADAIERTIDVASSFDSPFLYGLGPHALLLWRLIEWTIEREANDPSGHVRPTVIKHIRRVLRRRHLDTSTRMQWKCALAVLRANEGRFSYSALAPVEIAKARYVSLRRSGAKTSSAFRKYLVALGHSPTDSDDTPQSLVGSREVVIVSQRGAQVDAPVKFGAARAQMALAQYLMKQGALVLLLGNSDRRYGYTENVPFLGVQSEKGLRRALESLSPLDVLIGISRADIFARAVAGTPVVYQHGPHLPEGARALAIIKRQEVPVIVVSLHSLYSQIGFGIPREQLHVIFNGYNHEVFTLSNDRHRNPHRLVFAGNGVPYKGLDIAVNAFALLKSEFADAEFQLFGSTHESYAEADHTWSPQWLNSAGQVEWGAIQGDLPGITHFGEVTQTTLADAFRQSSLLVMPSRITETFGLVSLEAQACGCLPVLPRHGGFPETLREGVTGYLYDDNTPASLARCVAQLWRQDLPAESQRVRAATWVKNEFALEKNGARVVELIGNSRSKNTRFMRPRQVFWTLGDTSRKQVSRIRRLLP